VTRDQIAQALGPAAERLVDAIDAYTLAQALAAHAAAQWATTGSVAGGDDWRALLEAEKMAAARRADLGLTATRQAARTGAGRPVGSVSAADRVAQVPKVTRLKVAGS